MLEQDNTKYLHFTYKLLKLFKYADLNINVLKTMITDKSLQSIQKLAYKQCYDKKEQRVYLAEDFTSEVEEYFESTKDIQGLHDLLSDLVSQYVSKRQQDEKPKPLIEFVQQQYREPKNIYHQIYNVKTQELNQELWNIHKYNYVYNMINDLFIGFQYVLCKSIGCRLVHSQHKDIANHYESKEEQIQQYLDQFYSESNSLSINKRFKLVTKDTRHIGFREIIEIQQRITMEAIKDMFPSDLYINIILRAPQTNHKQRVQKINHIANIYLNTYPR